MNKATTGLLLLLRTLVTTLLATPRVQAQDETIRLQSPKYVAKDIGGKEYDIDVILSPGKAILVGFSTIWCDSRWALHKLGVLEKIHGIFGPDGANQTEVLQVGASGEPLEAIYGDVNRFRDQSTKGDQRKDEGGKPVLYPIISDRQLAVTTLGHAIPSFPTFILMGPDRRWVRCDDAVYGRDAQSRYTFDPNFRALRQMLTLFLTQDDKSGNVEFIGMIKVYLGEKPTFNALYTSATPITSIEYSAPEGVTVTKISNIEFQIESKQAGTFGITVTVVNKSGEARGSVSMTVSTPISSSPLVATINNQEQIGESWRSIDYDGDGYDFDSILGRGLYGRLKVNTQEGYNIGAENSKDALTSWGGFFPIQMDDKGRIQGYEITARNELRFALMVIDANAAKPTSSCYIQYYVDDAKPDRLEVMAAEPGGTPGELLAPQTPTEDWKLIQAGLSAYRGKTVHLPLIPVVNGESGIAVDQLRVTMDGTTDVETSTLSLQTSLHPNPASGHITIHMVVNNTIELFASDGTLAATAQMTSAEMTISVAQLPAGRYPARITALDDGTIPCPIITRQVLDSITIHSLPRGREWIGTGAFLSKELR